jgi:hypothetical protein
MEPICRSFAIQQGLRRRTPAIQKAILQKQAAAQKQRCKISDVVIGDLGRETGRDLDWDSFGDLRYWLPQSP